MGPPECFAFNAATPEMAHAYSCHFSQKGKVTEMNISLPLLIEDSQFLQRETGICGREHKGEKETLLSSISVN